MKFVLCLFLSYFIFSVASAQTITVLDLTTSQPLEGSILSVVGTNSYVHSDKNGRAEIGLNTGDTLVIKRVGYHVAKYGYDELSKKSFKILLTEKRYSLDDIVVSASKFEEKQADAMLGSAPTWSRHQALERASICSHFSSASSSSWSISSNLALMRRASAGLVL